MTERAAGWEGGKGGGEVRWSGEKDRRRTREEESEKVGEDEGNKQHASSSIPSSIDDEREKREGRLPCSYELNRAVQKEAVGARLFGRLTTRS